MIASKAKIAKAKIEYGDFQTPLDLAEQVCQKLVTLDINPDVIIEPTCGVGHFIDAASRSFPAAKQIIGVEVNPHYIEVVETKKQLLQDARIELQQADFFQLNWLPIINKLEGKILVLGNFPWVTNSQQGNIGGENLPQKTNFQSHSGLDAITGKSNFDISEWMLIQVVQWLQGRDAVLAMLCKTSVARKLLGYLHSRNCNLSHCSTYGIDARKYFDATVEACLLVCTFDTGSRNYFCDVFYNFTDSGYNRIGYSNNRLVRDLIAFEKLDQLYDAQAQTKWRSGIKHDCSNVMELRKVGDTFVNGFGEVVDLEDTYLFPLIKGSDVAQNRLEETNRYVLVTQKTVGEATKHIQVDASKTWKYLMSHAENLDNRKSKIYQNNPRFSMFGVGDYTFSAWKIAICGLYKRLGFRLIGEVRGKPTLFDDTVYFLSFDDEQVARKTFNLLTSSAATEFYSSLIFWDEKRPVKASILNCLNLAALEADQVNYPSD
jgi:hypothetical protein